MKVSEKISTNHSPVVLVVAMVAGLGVILMLIALAVGVVQGADANTNAIGLFFATGLVLFLLGAASWIAVVQPQKHFDDINKPAEEEHHGHAASETALVETTERHPEVAGHSH